MSLSKASPEFFDCVRACSGPSGTPVVMMPTEHICPSCGDTEQALEVQEVIGLFPLVHVGGVVQNGVLPSLLLITTIWWFFLFHYMLYSHHAAMLYFIRVM